MTHAHDINYLKREDIDTNRWDQCIDKAGNGLIYAYSFYLDNMAKHWDALVLNDYETVMPLTWNIKWGIKYLYQPPFTQKLGIFSLRSIDSNIMSSFIEITKSKFGFAEIFLNCENQITGTVKKPNYILQLQYDYDDISGSYKTDMLKNLKHSKKSELIYSGSDEYEEAISLFMKRYGKRIPHVAKKDYDNFFGLCKVASKKNMLIVRKVSGVSNELLAIALFLKDSRRLYNIMSTTLPNGRGLGANHFLYDELIKEFAGNSIILDFEGSEIPGIEWFYQKFGAMNEPYYFFRYNRLPWPFRFLKKL